MAVQKAPFQWPDAALHSIEGSGDMDLSWGSRKFSGSFALRLQAPSMLILEVYGAFGQTLLQLRKLGDQVDIVTAEGKSEDERFFEEQYGMSVDRFTDDLTMKGLKRKSEEGNYIDRPGYRVLYTIVRERPRTCWLSPEGSICLTFGDLEINKSSQTSESSRK